LKLLLETPLGTIHVVEVPEGSQMITHLLHFRAADS
jgi:hypothetical protein